MKMKRIVVITISAIVPDTVNLSSAVADVLENHARDIRNIDSLAGRSATGFLNVEQGDQEFRVEWHASYAERPTGAHDAD